MPVTRAGLYDACKAVSRRLREPAGIRATCGLQAWYRPDAAPLPEAVAASMRLLAAMTGRRSRWREVVHLRRLLRRVHTVEHLIGPVT